MFTINPFSELSGLISPIAMQIYVIAMVILVVGGTLLDTIHKKSAKYFFENSEKAEENGQPPRYPAGKRSALPSKQWPKMY